MHCLQSQLSGESSAFVLISHLTVRSANIHICINRLLRASPTCSGLRPLQSFQCNALAEKIGNAEATHLKVLFLDKVSTIYLLVPIFYSYFLFLSLLRVFEAVNWLLVISLRSVLSRVQLPSAFLYAQLQQLLLADDVRYSLRKFQYQKDFLEWSLTGRKSRQHGQPTSEVVGQAPRAQP